MLMQFNAIHMRAQHVDMQTMDGGAGRCPPVGVGAIFRSGDNLRKGQNSIACDWVSAIGPIDHSRQHVAVRAQCSHGAYEV